jgi:hypothetical protein
MLVLANSGAPTAKRLTIPDTIRLVVLPPSSPNLTPIARVWRAVKAALAWTQFTDVDTQQHYVGELLGSYDPVTLHSLTAYTYFVEAVNALST